MASLSASVISGRPASFRLSVQISSTRRYASALAGDFRQSKNSRIVSVVTLRAPSRSCHSAASRSAVSTRAFGLPMIRPIP